MTKLKDLCPRQCLACRGLRPHRLNACQCRTCKAAALLPPIKTPYDAGIPCDWQEGALIGYRRGWADAKAEAAELLEAAKAVALEQTGPLGLEGGGDVMATAQYEETFARRRKVRSKQRERREQGSKALEAQAPVSMRGANR